MTLRPQVASEVEEGLTGPANSLDESIDCGCAMFRMEKLEKFATRKVFVTLLSLIGIAQAAAHAYFYVSSATLARRFQIDPYEMEWYFTVSEITLIFLGLVIAYWGDRFHRAAWVGGLALIQSASLLALLATQLGNPPRIISIENLTYSQHYLHPEENPEKCTDLSSRLVVKNIGPDIFIRIVLIAAQVVWGVANVAFYALGLSYLDDNTRKTDVTIHLGIVISSKFMGLIIGYLLAWTFLKIDSQSLGSITSYTQQIGAWWIGGPIFAILLGIPALLMSWFPRKLPSVIIEQGAAQILSQASNEPSYRKKVGNPDFFPSLMRIYQNKILMFNVLAASILITALFNFFSYQNVFLESRFYAPRPTATFLGFQDPLTSRLIITIAKPILIGIVVIISGFVIARFRPKATTLVFYSIGIAILSAVIVFALGFGNCEKLPINGLRSGSLDLVQYCNSKCHCSEDADFRPICDLSSRQVFYSPCHAGCKTIDLTNGKRIYSDCECIKEVFGEDNHQAMETPCGSGNCQLGWTIVQIASLIVCLAAASTIVGDLLISLRSVNVQDKALAIGFAMSFIGFLTFIPGKIVYDKIADLNCIYWGYREKHCHLHHPQNFGYFLNFLTAILLAISASIRVLVLLFSRDLDVYETEEGDDESMREMHDMGSPDPLLQRQPPTEYERQTGTDEPESGIPPVQGSVAEGQQPARDDGSADTAQATEDLTTTSAKFMHAPLGTEKKGPYTNVPNRDSDDEVYSSSDDDEQTGKKNCSTSQVSYKPLELESEFESNFKDNAARSRKGISRSEYDESFIPEIPPRIRQFPNPDDYPDPRATRSSKNNSSEEHLGSHKTEESKSLHASRGDFNEIGIPLVENYEAQLLGSTSSLRSATVLTAIHHLSRDPSREILLSKPKVPPKPYHLRSTDKILFDSNETNTTKVVITKTEQESYNSISPRPGSRGQSSSGFGSLQDLHTKSKQNDGNLTDSKESLSSEISESCYPPRPPKAGGPLCTKF